MKVRLVKLKTWLSFLLQTQTSFYSEVPLQGTAMNKDWFCIYLSIWWCDENRVTMHQVHRSLNQCSSVVILLFKKCLNKVTGIRKAHLPHTSAEASLHLSPVLWLQRLCRQHCSCCPPILWNQYPSLLYRHVGAPVVNCAAIALFPSTFVSWAIWCVLCPISFQPLSCHF